MDSLQDLSALELRRARTWCETRIDFRDAYEKVEHMEMTLAVHDEYERRGNRFEPQECERQRVA